MAFLGEAMQGKVRCTTKGYRFPTGLRVGDPDVLECRPSAKWLGMIWDDDA
jgi:hypothetical protein